MLLPLAGFLFLAAPQANPDQTASEVTAEEIALVPFITSEVREHVPYAAQICIASQAKEAIELRQLTVRVPKGFERTIDLENRSLVGDPEYFAVNAMIERLPHSVTEVHREEHLFATPDAKAYPEEELGERLKEVWARIDDLRIGWEKEVPVPFVQVSFNIDLDQIFEVDVERGATATLEIELEYQQAGEAQTISTTQLITWIGPRAGVPPTFLAGSPAGVTIAAGDLHVHSCHGEAAGACAPSTNCTAESFQTSGSFTYAELRTQYEAIGMSWYTATDHSYCINSDAEYQVIVAEAAAATDAGFFVQPDIELSSDEEGSQTGSDLANALCLGLTSANHMGAHDITQRLEGGEDGFLGFCDGFFSDVLDDFTDSITAVRNQGGFPIAHHPTASSYAWNSFNATQGLEAGGLQGVEIWNGDPVPGQGGDVARWVDWLLGGRILYGYGGSDTHDQAFDFGANHALLINESFSSESVMDALRAGRLYVSNGPSLILEVERGGVVHLMGEQVVLPAGGPAQNAEVRAHVEFESGMSGTVTLFTGVVGGASESTLGTSSSISGSGVYTLPTAVGGGSNRTWIRAFAVSANGTQAAYSNPVFFEPNGPSVFDAYCSADGTGCTACPCGNDAPAGTQGGCLNSEGRSAQLLGSGSPSLANDTLRFEVRSAGSSTFALLTSGDRRLPSNPVNPCYYAGSGVISPVLDGLRCIGGNFQRHGARPTDANGDIGVTTNGWGAPNGPAGGLAAQGAFTSGQTRQFQAFYRDLLTAPACGLGQNTTDAVSVLFLP